MSPSCLSLISSHDAVPQEARIAFHSKSLRHSDKELTGLFVQVRDSRGRIDCAPVHEMLLYNRQQLLETLQEQQALHRGEPSAAEKRRLQREKEGKKETAPKKAKAAKASDKDGAKEASRAKKKERRLQELQGAPEGFKYCHCKAQAPPPPGGGAAAWICHKDDSAANGYHKWNTHPRSRAACNLADTVRIPPATATSGRNLNPVRSSTASRGSRGCRRKC